MATAVITLTNIKQGVASNGKRSVEATLDFDTGDYVTNGLVLSTVSTVVGTDTFTGLLAAIGLKQIEQAYVSAFANVDAPYTQAQWVTANTTTSYAHFVDNATNGTLQAPRLVIYSNGAQLAAGPIAAAAQVRIMFRGH